MGETKSCRCPQNVPIDNNNNNNILNDIFFLMKTTKFLIHSYFKKMLNSMIICKRLRKLTDQPQMSGSLKRYFFSFPRQQVTMYHLLCLLVLPRIQIFQRVRSNSIRKNKSMQKQMSLTVMQSQVLVFTCKTDMMEMNRKISDQWCSFLCNGFHVLPLQNISVIGFQKDIAYFRYEEA